MNLVLEYLRWLVAWLGLAAFGVVAFGVALVNGLTGNLRRAERTFRTMSRLAAAVLGYSGANSLSAECGARNNWGERFIDWLLGAGHCEQERKNEHLPYRK